jgi:hypothetical protein
MLQRRLSADKEATHSNGYTPGRAAASPPRHQRFAFDEA